MLRLIPLLVCIVGLVIFCVSKTNPDSKKLGEHMFWTGLLATLLQLHETLRAF